MRTSTNMQLASDPRQNQYVQALAPQQYNRRVPPSRVAALCLDAPMIYDTPREVPVRQRALRFGAPRAGETGRCREALSPGWLAVNSGRRTLEEFAGAQAYPANSPPASPRGVASVP